MITGQTHYRAYFDIEALKSSRVDCGSIAKVIRKWITDKEGKNAYDNLGQSSFFTGTDWIKTENKRVHVHTVSNAEVISPCTLWSIRYEHPDSEHSIRLWVSDITIQQVSDQLIRFAMHVYFRIAPGFIAEEPPLPAPSTPKIISHLLTSRDYIAKAGSSELTVEYSIVTARDAAYFADEITTNSRLIPYVVISEDTQDNIFLNPVDLALKLAGNAKVFLLKHDAQENYNSGVGYYLGCSDGMVRVYKPLAKNTDYDSKRHRFFQAADIKSFSADAVTAQLLAGLVRRGKTFLERRPISREDVLSEITRVKMQQLRARMYAGATQLQVNELSETFEALLSTTEKERDDAMEQIGYYENEYESLQSEIEQFKQKVFARDQRIAALQEKEDQLNNVYQALEAFKSLDKLPESISEVVKIISRIHSTSITFTKEAHNSASDTKFEDVGIVWEALWHLGTTLPRLVFETDIKNIEGEFKKKTGLDISFTEGKMTKSDKKLVSQRLVQHGGKSYEVIPHIKLQKSGRHFRIHFAIDRDEKKVIVGHCGDHLDTSGTRRRS